MYVHVPFGVAGLGRLLRWRLCSVSRWSGAIRWPTWRRWRSARSAPAVHRAVPGHRQPVGQADVGRLVGVGRAADLVLVLFFLYLGHIALVRAFDDPQRGYRAGAILALVGVVNLPIIKFSVDWWNTLHQPASITLTGAPTMYIGMLWPLLISPSGSPCCCSPRSSSRALRAAVMERRIRRRRAWRRMGRGAAQAGGDRSARGNAKGDRMTQAPPPGPAACVPGVAWARRPRWC
jgi:hypothetical protein